MPLHVKIVGVSLALTLVCGALPVFAESNPATDPICGGPIEPGRRAADGSPKLARLDYLIGVWRVISYQHTLFRTPIKELEPWLEQNIPGGFR